MTVATPQRTERYSSSMTIPIPQRINNKILGVFYPLNPEELIRLYQAGLLKSAAYVHFALRMENPFCDRPMEIIPKEFSLRWGIPEKSVYRAIAKLKELNILKIKSGKIVVTWAEEVKQPEEPVDDLPNVSPEPIDSTNVSKGFGEPKKSQKREKIPRSKKKFSEVRKHSQLRENESLEALPDIDPRNPHTLHTINTNHTNGRLEKILSSPNQEQQEEKVISEKDIKAKKKITRDVVQEKSKVLNSSRTISRDVERRLEELGIVIDQKVLDAIASHHISQTYGAIAHIEKTFDSINNARGVFLFQLPKQKVEQVGSRYSEDILKNLVTENQQIEELKKDPEYQAKSKKAFAQIRATLDQKSG